MPFTCSYCGQTFCSEHRLPEKHQCPALPNLKKGKWSKKTTLDRDVNNETQGSPKPSNPPSLMNRIKGWYSRRFGYQEWSYGGRSGYRRTYHKTRRQLSRLTSNLVQITVIVFLSLPLYLFYLIDAEISQDPFTAILLRDFINENVYFPVGLFGAALLYFLYKKTTSYKIKFEWIILGTASLVSTYMIHRFLGTMTALSSLFRASHSQFPTLFELYEYWGMLMFHVCRNALERGYALGIDFIRLTREYLGDLYSSITG